MLEALQQFFQQASAAIMLPIIIFILGLILGAKPGRAFRAGVTIGVAFIGINLVIGLMWGTLSTTAQAIVTKTGASLTVVDVGWPTSATIAFASTVGLYIIPVALLVNIVMLAVGLTKTLNIDVWNFWHFAFAGALVVVITGSLAMGIAAAAVFAALMLFMADWTAKSVQQFFNLPGLSIPHGFSTSMTIPTIFLNWLIDKIPGLKDWNADTDAIQRRFGVFGEPLILGLVIGLVLGAIAFLPPADGNWVTGTLTVLTVGMELAAVMFLLPRMVAILMEGLIPISEAARDFMNRRFGGGEVWVGLDSAILIGHPAALAASLVLVPIVIALAVFLPGNEFLPFADLAVFPFLFAMMAPITRGNVGRMIIIGTIMSVVGLYMGTWMAPYITQAAVDAGAALPEGASLISAVGDGWDIWVYLFVWPASISPIFGWVAAGVILAGVVVAALLFKRNTSSWEALTGAKVEAEAASPAMD